MDWGIALGVAVVVVILGGVAAIAWWRLANRTAPYRDQAGGKNARDHENVIIIRDEKSDTRG